MVVDGCDIVDIGAESTRPEAQAIDEAEELTRLDRVLEEIARLDVPISIDTTKSAVAARARSIMRDARKCAARSVQLGETP